MTAELPLLSIDHANAGLGMREGGALDLGALEAARARWDARYRDGALGFVDLPEDADLLDQVTRFAIDAPAVHDVVVVGIGGSALGARVFDAIRPRPGGVPRLHVLDTVGPGRFYATLKALDPRETLLLGVSKSGTTLETAVLFPLLERFLAGGGPGLRDRVAVVTGPGPSPLRERAEARGYRCLDVPENVGGRFSALTAVGLLPAALVGVSPERLLAGAAAARAALDVEALAQNPAFALALVHLRAWRAGCHTAVIWPYGERLGPLGPWTAQLVTESTGQVRADGTGVGVAAFGARGPADQHSLLQLLLDGPPGRLAVFVSAPTAGEGPRVEVAGAADVRLGYVLEAEREATAEALAGRGRPSVSIRLRDTGPEAVGAYLFTYEAAVALLGFALEIDPFVQPAVALGKRAALERLASPVDPPAPDQKGMSSSVGPPPDGAP